MQEQPIMQLKSLTKSFFGTEVLHGIDLDIYPGEVHSLVGENGAGKSTLVKVIGGVHSPDSGEILYHGKPVHFSYPGEAHKLGIYYVQQEPSLMHSLTVAENVFMGIHPMTGGRIDRRTMNKLAKEVFARLDIDIDVTMEAGYLGIAQQQMVEIAKSLVRDVRVLILDEPTSVLSLHESEALFKLVRQLVGEGKSVLFISHRLEEVFGLSQRVTVLRDGQMVGTFGVEELDESKLVSLMVGRELSMERRSSHARDEAPVLDVEHLSVPGLYEDVSFQIRPGEVVGMAGLVGAGRTEIAETLFGLHKPSTGKITLNGRKVSIKSTKQAIRSGIVYVPEDRHKHGLALPMSIRDNMTAAVLKRMTRGTILSKRREEALCQNMSERMNVRMLGIGQSVGNLSGGNQQKVVLGKWISVNPTLILLDEPTRGVDVGAKGEIHKIIDELALQGAAVLVISSDLPEVIALSDRVLVMREGHLVGELSEDKINEQDIMRLAAGVSESPKEVTSL